MQQSKRTKSKNCLRILSLSTICLMSWSLLACDSKKDQDKDKKQNPDKKDEQGKPQPKPGGISPERLQNLMDAVNNEEKKVQEKVNAQKVQGKPVQTEKDW